MTLKKRNVGTQERGKCTIRHIPTACRIDYELRMFKVDYFHS